MQPFTATVIEIIQGIPDGKVMTYGQIAGLAGSPRAARQVVRILHSMSDKYHLPWHRVINSLGETAIKVDEMNALQQLFLQSEGIEISADNRINLELYQYHPERF